MFLHHYCMLGSTAIRLIGAYFYIEKIAYLIFYNNSPNI